jgi:hypothetical protein
MKKNNIHKMLLLIDLNKKKGEKGGVNFICIVNNKISVVPMVNYISIFLFF